MRVDSHLTVHFGCVVLCALSLRHELPGHLNTTEPLSMMLVTPESKCLQRKGPLDFLNAAKLVFLWLLPAEKTSVLMSKAELMSHAFVWCSFGGLEKFNLPVFVILVYFIFFLFSFLLIAPVWVHSSFTWIFDLTFFMFSHWCFSAVWFTATLQHWWTHNRR